MFCLESTFLLKLFRFPKFYQNSFSQFLFHTYFMASETNSSLFRKNPKLTTTLRLYASGSGVHSGASAKGLWERNMNISLLASVGSLLVIASNFSMVLSRNWNRTILVFVLYIGLHATNTFLSPDPFILA